MSIENQVNEILNLKKEETRIVTIEEMKRSFESVIDKIREEMVLNQKLSLRLARDYALSAITGKLEDRKMNEDTTNRYVYRANVWETAISILNNAVEDNKNRR